MKRNSALALSSIRMMMATMFVSYGEHPDAVYHTNADGEYKKSGLYDDDKYEVFQWLLFIAGNLTFRFHAWSLAQYASREWYQVDD